LSLTKRAFKTGWGLGDDRGGGMGVSRTELLSARPTLELEAATGKMFSLKQWGKSVRGVTLPFEAVTC